MKYKKVFTSLLFASFLLTITTSCTGGVSRSSSSSSDGNCQFPDDRAADGSRCGDRAASVRPGGN